LTRLLTALLAFTALAGAAHAQDPQPEPAPPTPPIVQPRDVAYPGQIGLEVDARDVTRRIFQVHETVPVTAGQPVTLLYPEWLPGNHSPSGPVFELAGLIVTANGQRVEWTRDPVNVFAFHIDVPAGASSLDLHYQFLAPTQDRVGRVMATPEMLNLEWNTVVLYPAGYFSRDITYRPSVMLPAGWRFGTALDGASRQGDQVSFAPVTLNTLVDSPMLAGRYFRQEILSDSPVPVRLDIAADRPEDLAFTPEQLQKHRELVRQAYLNFGSHHYDHYDFLLWLSDEMGGEGLEHHRSSEDGTHPDYFTGWEGGAPERDLLAHEFTHSWDGKFRRPADLWTPNFNVPMRDSLLWVYEGQTQYWGYVLAARAGLWTRQQALDALALTAATYNERVGRRWKPVEDTTNDPIIAQRRSESWRSWQRSEDYYSEGQLIWLDADTLIRERTGGRKSLDDFARGFFGVRNGSYVTDTYTFDDVVAALNAVTPYDWRTFLRSRLDGHGPGAPLDGLARGGYRLVYTDTPSAFQKDSEKMRHSTDLSFSIGVVLDKDGHLVDVHWEGPAFDAGLTTGGQIVAVNGLAYDADKLKDAIKAARTTGGLDLLVKTGDHVRAVHIAYSGGLRYPHLERVAGTPARLDAIFAPKS
jgi:predicted metalloprotease with PDZ domain